MEEIKSNSSSHFIKWEANLLFHENKNKTKQRNNKQKDGRMCQESWLMTFLTCLQNSRELNEYMELHFKVYAQVECIIFAVLNSLEGGLCSVMFNLLGMQKEKKGSKWYVTTDYNHSSKEMVTLTAKKKDLIFNTYVGYLKIIIFL